MDGVQGYDDDQIALVIPGLSNFMAWVPVILGIPTISCIINVIKDRELDALVMPWVNAWMAYLLAVDELQLQWKMVSLLLGSQTLVNMMK